MPLTYCAVNDQYRFTFDRLVLARGRVRKSVLFPPGLTAEQAQQRELEETARIYTELLEPPAEQDPSVSDVVAGYLEDRKDPASRRRAEAHLTAIAWAFEGRRLSELAAVACDVLKTGKERGLAPATVRVRLSVLKAAARHAWLVRRLTTSDPSKGMCLPRIRY